MSDIVYSCRLKESEGTVKVSLLIEHKSHPDKYTPVQIGGYIFSALQKQIQNKEPLSLVIPVLLYHGKAKWKYRTLANLFEGINKEWEQFLPGFEYIYNDLGRLSDVEIEALNNKFLAASFLALKHSQESPDSYWEDRAKCSGFIDAGIRRAKRFKKRFHHLFVQQRKVGRKSIKFVTGFNKKRHYEYTGYIHRKRQKRRL